MAGFRDLAVAAASDLANGRCFDVEVRLKLDGNYCVANDTHELYKVSQVYLLVKRKLLVNLVFGF